MSKTCSLGEPEKLPAGVIVYLRAVALRGTDELFRISPVSKQAENDFSPELRAHFNFLKRTKRVLFCAFTVVYRQLNGTNPAYLYE